MSAARDLLRRYRIGLEHPDVSGFELLDLLETRSALARTESDLEEAERLHLEKTDALFLDLAATLYRHISEVANLAESCQNPAFSLVVVPGPLDPTLGRGSIECTLNHPQM